MNIKRKRALMKGAIVSFLMFGLMLSVFMSPLMMLPDSGRTAFSPIKTYGVAANPSVAVWKNFTTLHDTDNLYGGNYFTYQFTTNVTDTDGNISNVSLWFETAGSTKYYGLLYNNATNAFTERYNASFGVESSSAVVGRGTSDWLNITWKFTVEWAHTDVDNLRVVVDVMDGDSTSHLFNSSATYDFDTDLILYSDTTLFTYSTYGAGEHAGTSSVTYAYEDSGGDNYPLAAQTDFWVTRPATVDLGLDSRNYEAESYSDSTGVASWTTIVMSDTEAGGHTEAWSIFAVKQADGATGTSLMGTTYTETITIEQSPPADRQPKDGVTSIISMEDIAMYSILFGGCGAFVYWWMASHQAPKARSKKKSFGRSKKKRTKKR